MHVQCVSDVLEGALLSSPISLSLTPSLDFHRPALVLGLGLTVGKLPNRRLIQRVSHQVDCLGSLTPQNGSDSV